VVEHFAQAAIDPAADHVDELGIGVEQALLIELVGACMVGKVAVCGFAVVSVTREGLGRAEETEEFTTNQGVSFHKSWHLTHANRPALARCATGSVESSGEVAFNPQRMV